MHVYMVWKKKNNNNNAQIRFVSKLGDKYAHSLTRVPGYLDQINVHARIHEQSKSDS